MPPTDNAASIPAVNDRHRLDLTSALTFVREAGEMLAVLDGQVVQGEGREASQHEAYLARKLLNAADILAMATAFVRNEYWGLKEEVSFDVD